MGAVAMRNIGDAAGRWIVHAAAGAAIRVVVRDLAADGADGLRPHGQRPGRS